MFLKSEKRFSQVFLNMVVAGFAAELDPNDETPAAPEVYYPSLATIISPSGDTVTAEKCQDDRQTVEVNGALALLAVGNGAHTSGKILFPLVSPLECNGLLQPPVGDLSL